MDKLEAIKNKLRDMDNECKTSVGCKGCTYQDECYGKIPLAGPMDYLKRIEACEKLLND